MDWNAFVSSVFSKETAIGGFISIIFGAGGYAAFGRRFLSSSKALITNDKQWSDTLEKQGKYIDRLELALEARNADLKARDVEIEKKDELIRQYYQDLAATKAELQIIQSSQIYLTRKVDELTAVNQAMAQELSRLRSDLGAAR